MSLYDRDALIEAFARGETFKYLMFWGHKGSRENVGKECLSQWYPRGFDVEGVHYPTAEHFMMASKARLFEDSAMLEAILVSKTPGEAKKLGRKVQGFDDALWRAHRSEVVVAGNVAKFAQHEDLKQFLVGTGGRVLVEASPRDRIWGIGMGASNPLATQPAHWKGLNLLGFALMRARDGLVV